MGELVFVGLGLHDHTGISLTGLQEVKASDDVFIELYTSLLPDFSIQHFEELSGKTLKTVMRSDLEEQNGEAILEAARTGKTVLLVPGDPLIATTHIALRIEAEKRGIRTRIIHGSSIVSAAIGLSGLHNYKFGKTVTIPFPDETSLETPYRVIAQNKQQGLHTLCLLDIKVEERRFLTINEALEALLKTETKHDTGIVTSQSLVIGVARAGSNNSVVKAGPIKNILDHDFGAPPHCLIFPGGLHFMEAEALVVLAGAPETLMRRAK